MERFEIEKKKEVDEGTFESEKEKFMKTNRRKRSSFHFLGVMLIPRRLKVRRMTNWIMRNI